MTAADFEYEFSDEDVKLFEIRRNKRLCGESNTYKQKAKKTIAGKKYTDEFKADLDRRFAQYANSGKMVSAKDANKQIFELFKKAKRK